MDGSSEDHVHRDYVTTKSEEIWPARFADDFNRIARPITITEPGRILLASSFLGQRLAKCRSKQDPQRFLSPGISTFAWTEPLNLRLLRGSKTISLTLF